MDILHLNSIQEEISFDIFLSESKQNKKWLYLEQDNNKRVIFIYKLINCVCCGVSLSYPDLLLHSNLKLYLPIKEKTMSLNSSTIYSKTMKYETILKKNVKVITTPLFFFNYNLNNYYHFLYDALPNLYSYLYLKQYIETLKLIVYYPSHKNSFCKFVYEFLELLGITTQDILIFDETCIYKKIYVTTSYTHDFDSNLQPRKEIHEIYKLLVKNALKISTHLSTFDKIYISRRTWIHNDLSNIGTNYTTRRKMINEDELVEILKLQNYKEIFTENLSVSDKIVLFNKAKYVIGAIGGGIANMVFANENTKLLVIVSPYFFECNERFKYCFSTNNTVYFYNCSHFEKSLFKKYIRVKIKNTDLIGEIIEVNKNGNGNGNEILVIQYNEGKTTNIGWNYDNNYKNIQVADTDVICLDNGLNSSYVIDCFKILNFIL
jgi:capsular polysaccharide biosynthesis protein